jgi:glycosyltransferase involved in cell wall biosynthesis
LSERAKKLRILWFTHLPADAVNRHFGRPTTGTGFWIHSLVQPLVDSGQVELAIATATAGAPAFHFRDGAVEYFNVPQHKFLEVYNVLPRWRLSRYLEQCARIVREFKPDIVHVHGTERFFGLLRARGLIDVPTVVSIQGVMRQFQHWSWGSMSRWDGVRLMNFWEIARRATMAADAAHVARIAAAEEEILRGVDAVIGRTAWDQANARDVNPNVHYFHIDEMMRPEFWAAEPWSIDDVRPGTIFTTSSTAPRKGLPVLIRALSILRRWGHDARLKIAGLSRNEDRRSSAKFVFELIDRLALDEFIEPMGWVNATGLIGHMRQSCCFAQPSYAENSSNAISEAQLMGMPCIGAHSGGTPTLVEDEKTGLLFSRGDEVMLAAQIERLLTDSALANRIGAAGRVTAQRRHDPGQIVAAHLECYRQLAANPALTSTASRDG